MAHHTAPVTDVDPRQLEESRSMWRHFAVAVKWLVIAHVVGLLLLALILL
jgi:hypothetical protein